MSRVFLLSHSHRLSKANEETKIVGIYRSLFGAREALALTARLSGFRHSVDGFAIHCFELDADLWPLGFECTADDVGERTILANSTCVPVEISEPVSEVDARPAGAAYLLWHVRTLPHASGIVADGEESRLVGIYSSPQSATEAQHRVANLTGFADSPNGFSVSRYEIGKRHWTDGFATVTW